MKKWHKLINANKKRKHQTNTIIEVHYYIIKKGNFGQTDILPKESDHKKKLNNNEQL